MNIKKAIIYAVLIAIIYLSYKYKSQIIKRIISIQLASCIYNDNSGKSLPYRLYKPKFEKDKKYPMILYLHGGASCGNDNYKQLNKTINFLCSKEIQHKYPSIIMAPQCPNGKQWLNTTFKVTPYEHYNQKTIQESEEMKMVIKIIQELSISLPIDGKKIYVLGFSMGSSGTWDIICRHPDIFAAAIPISGVSDTTMAPKLIHMPIWAFHGKEDDIAPVCLNQEMQEAINKAGGNCKLTIFEKKGHSCEKEAIHYAALFDWLFIQNK